MGRPKEFFNVRSGVIPIASRNDLIGPESNLDVAAYLDHITRTHTSSNGVFGMKLLFSQLQWAMEFECACSLLAGSRYIWLTRRDVVAQAVSSYLARQLHAWSSAAEGRRADQGVMRDEIAYDEDTIRARIADLGQANTGWLEFFSVNGFDVLPVAYEDLVADPDSVCRAICEYCGVSIDSKFALESTRFKKQGDEVNQTFRTRFARESRLALRPAGEPPRSAVLKREAITLHETARELSGGRPTRSSSRGPDFVGIGAQKSATTFVFRMLRRHPRIKFPATRDRFNPPPVEVDGRQVVTWPKEIRFLHGHNANLSWEEYLEIFAGKEPGKIYGEITPFYLAAPRSRIEELREHVPDVRLFAILRDPVERDWSSIRMVAGRRGELDDIDALLTIADSHAIRSRGDYAGCLRNWLEVFPREQLLILPYELLKRDRLAFLGAICEHLGVSVDPIAEGSEETIFRGPGAALPDEIRHHLIDRHRGIVEELHELCALDFSEYWGSTLTTARSP
jgi:LPS sulfotransferase NodH